MQRSGGARVVIGEVIAPPVTQRVRGGGRARLRLVRLDVHHSHEPTRVVVSSPNAPPDVRVLAGGEGRGSCSSVEPSHDDHAVRVYDDWRACKLDGLPSSV